MVAPRKKKTSASRIGRYLRRFTLENVRTFRSPVTLDFCHADGRVAQWTVILGENGIGKTTVLQYLAGMRPVQDKDLNNIPGEDESGGRPLPFRPMVSGEDWIQWHVANLPQPWTKPMTMDVQLEVSVAAGSLAEAKAQEKMPPLGFQFVTDETDEGRAKVNFTFTSVPQLEFYEQFRMFGYGAGRHIAGPNSPYLMSETFFKNGGGSPVSTLFHDDYPLISPEQWLLGLDHALARARPDDRPQLEKAYVSAKRCLTNSLPDVAEVSVGPYGFQNTDTSLMLLCKVPYSLRPLPFGFLSVGYRTMAAWLTDFVKRMHEAFFGMGEADDGPAVVLIDEFDLHMHPKWQRTAMAALSKEFPNTQFIVTAHSPLAVQAADNEHAKIIVLKRRLRDDGLEEAYVADHPEEAAGWRVDQILESLYGVSPESPRVEELTKERVRLRQKEKLKAAEKHRLAKVEAELEHLTPPDEAQASKDLLAELKKALEAACVNK